MQVSASAQAARDAFHASRDINFYGADGPPFAVEAPSPLTPAGLAARPEQPSALLNARRAVVPFTGRVAELAAIETWCEMPAPRSAMLFHAAGGQGKTRLATRAGEQASGRGWLVGYARHRTDSPSGGQLLDLEAVGEQPRLLIVDYAERWPSPDLAALLREAVRSPSRLRMLLLARSTSWWPAVRAECENLRMVTAEPHELPTLAPTETERRELFEAAYLTFTEIYQLPAPPTLRPAGRLSDPVYGLTLSLHMAALAAVDAHANHMQPPGSAADLSRYLLDRERRYWEQLHGSGNVSAAARCVFLAALAGAQFSADGLALLEHTRLPEATGTTAQQLLDAHDRCYPPMTMDTVLEPLYPDRLAEDFIALTLSAAPAAYADSWSANLITTACRVKDQIEYRPGRIFGPADQLSTAYLRRALIFLAGAAARSADTQNRLRRLLTTDPQLVVRAGGAALLAVTPHTDIELALTIHGCLPDHHIDLDPAAAVLAAHIVHLSATSSNLDQHATNLNTLAVRRANAGLREQALMPAAEAVDMRRQLARANPDYLPGLAKSLNNYGTVLSELARQEEALAAIEEAVTVYRRLDATNPDDHLADLAMALNNLGLILPKLQHWAPALAASEEAVAAYRRLGATTAGDEYLPDLATSLNNLGNRLSQLGRHQQALVVAEEAVAIRRKLAETNPASYLPNLGTSLNNLGNRLSQLGRHQQALVVAEEAVAIRRKLAETNPVAYLPNLATSLTSLGDRLAELGDHEQAARVAAEACAIRF